MGEMEQADVKENQISAYLNPLPDHISELAQNLRAWFRSEYSPTFELVAESTMSVNIGYGFTRKAWDCFAAIIIYKNHINISLPSGAGLSDPHGILHGTGKRIRHIKIKRLEELMADEVTAILEEARNNANAMVPKHEAEKVGVETRVKPVS